MRFFLLILLLAAPLCGRDVNVTAIEVNAARKLRIESAVEGAFEKVSTKTGLADSERINLTLCGDERSFAQLARADGVSMHAENVLGYAEPALRKVVLNLAAIDARRLTELGVLRHEIAHLVMGSALKSKRPLWFEEGVAQWVESVPLDALTEGASPDLAMPSYASFDELDAGLRDNREAGAAYKQARSVVEFFVKRFGEPKLRELLQKLRQPGVGFSAAFKEVTSDEYKAFERDAMGELKAQRENMFWLFLGANWWWMLFTFGAVLALLAYLRRRRRTKDLIDQWEEQEKLYPSDPSWSYPPDDPTEEFRRGIAKKFGEPEEDAEEIPPPPPNISDEGLRHWYDKRREQKPPSPPPSDAPSAEELKKWIDEKDEPPADKPKPSA